MLLLYCVFASSAIAWSPTNSYAPGVVDCPAGSLTRPAIDGLNAAEEQYVTGRKSTAKAALISFLDGLDLADFDASSFLGNSSITTGLAFSGGGYRAMMVGAGQLSALDNRTSSSSSSAYDLAGLLQSATYLAGLSGGSWLVGTVALNNYSTIEQLHQTPEIWDLSTVISYPGANASNLTATYGYLSGLDKIVQQKASAGFQTSVNDIWGLTIAERTVNVTDGGPALTWSDIGDFDAIKNFEMPYPIVVGLLQYKNEVYDSSNSTVIEISPSEFGSWDPNFQYFAETKYLGSSSNGTCVAGYDNGGFVMGTSSQLLAALSEANTSLSSLVSVLGSTFFAFDSTDDRFDALYAPNPFTATDINTNIKSRSHLNLVDGGTDSQVIPFLPLLQSERDVDIIFAFDSSADSSTGWPNGASLRATYERQFSDQGANITFPYVADSPIDELRPYFFGCNASNLTSLLTNDNKKTPPFIVYIPNSYYSFESNLSTFQLSYTTQQVDGMLQNGYETATYGNGTIDSEWKTCVGCAIIQRELDRRGKEPSSQCQKCFANYCYGGYGGAGNSTVGNSTTSGNFSTSGANTRASGSSVATGTARGTASGTAATSSSTGETTSGSSQGSQATASATGATNGATSLTISSVAMFVSLCCLLL